MSILTLNLHGIQFHFIVRWKIFQEDTTGCSLLSSRKEGGIFQNIRFAVMTSEQLADKFILVSQGLLLV